MTLKHAFLALPVAALCALGCGGSPTSSKSFQLSITATVSNTAMQATIQDTQLLVDGATTEDVTVLTPLASVPFTVTGNAGSGGHTLPVLIPTQTTTPQRSTAREPRA